MLDELPLDQGFALIAEATEANPWGAVERKNDGYIAQERLNALNPDPK